MNELKPEEATMSGQAQRVPALKAQPGSMTATIHITRKATGQVETHQLILTPQQEQENGSHS